MEQKTQTGATERERFYAALTEFSRFYLYLVLGCGAILAVSVVGAVYASIWAGVLVAALVAGIYRWFLADELKKKLGFSEERVSDGLSLSLLPRDGEERFIPEKLLWLEVTELSASACVSEENATVRAIYLPKTLRRIKMGAFDGLSALEVICFEGDIEAWAKVEKEIDLRSYRVILRSGEEIISE